MSWDNAGGGGDTTFEEPAATGEFAFDNVYGGGGEGDDGGYGAEGGGGGGGACYNCGQEGHRKGECTNAPVPREFTGECRLCGEVGHRASDCPTAPPKVCNNCAEPGHAAVECKNPRKLTYKGVNDVSAEQAWEEMKAASDERDLDDFKEALKKYCKATRDTTYAQLENAFRGQGFSIYLIGIEKELQPTYTNMDLQGNLDKTFTVSFRFSDKHQRPKEKEIWPASPEENLARLEDAGEPIDRGVPLCSNCSTLGHISKSCPEEKQENADRAVVKCYNCEQVGHRVRDCTVARPDKFACRNFGHFSKDCPTRVPFECRNCGGDHKAKDCTEPKKLICKNCDEEGHTGRECTKPRDWSRVKCSNCQQMGHTKVRCKEPIVDEDAAGNDGGDGAAPFSFEDNTAAGGDFGNGDDEFLASGVAATNDYSAPAITASSGWEGGQGGGGW